MQAMRGARPAVIVLGGFAGAGKTTLCRRLSAELGIPTLGSDTIGETIKQSEGIRGGAVDAYWIGYDVLFGLCEEFLRSGVSAILDLSMGWAFQWQRLDAIGERQPGILSLPIVLRCPREVCIERIRERRRAANPTGDDPAGLSRQLLDVWEFLQRLERPGVHFVDAARGQDEVYEELRRYVTGRLSVTTRGS